ncbi:MAG: sugar nucleotide-binding protein [Pirellulales bacterium]
MIVVVGASGYIGQGFARALAAREVEFLPASRREFNYYDGDLLRRWLARNKAQFVINAAGFTGRPNVDACELERRQCLLANAALPGIVQSACESLGIPCGHVSSGCIFSGTRSGGHGFRETDRPNFTFRQDNCSFYSGCKALAEETLTGAQACYVWRLRLPFSHIDSPRNLLSKLMRYERLIDVRNSMSRYEEFIEACLDCWTKRLEFGTYHLTNGGSLTTREIADRLIAAGIVDRPFRYFQSNEEFMASGVLAPRSNCVLDNSKALDAGLALASLDDAMNDAIRHWSVGACDRSL